MYSFRTIRQRLSHPTLPELSRSRHPQPISRIFPDTSSAKQPSRRWTKALPRVTRVKPLLPKGHTLVPFLSLRLKRYKVLVTEPKEGQQTALNLSLVRTTHQFVPVRPLAGVVFSGRVARASYSEQQQGAAEGLLASSTCCDRDVMRWQGRVQL